MYLNKEMIIIKKLLTITLSLLMIGSIVTGCGKKDVTVKDTSTATNTTTSSNANSNATKPEATQKTSNVTTKSDPVKNNTTKAPVKVEQKQPYYGQWKINKQIAFGPASIYSNDDIKKMIGKTISYSDIQAAYDTVTCKNPYYKKSTISSTNFETSNKTKFSTLGITTNSVDQVTVFTNSSSNNIWDSAGSVFYLKDQNTLILFDGGVYFELTKVIS